MTVACPSGPEPGGHFFVPGVRSEGSTGFCLDWWIDAFPRWGVETFQCFQRAASMQDQRCMMRKIGMAPKKPITHKSP